MTPPFTYNYQCGNELLTTYIPVYLYSYIFLIVGPPIIYVVMIFSSKYYNIPEWIMERLPGLAFPEFWSTTPSPLNPIDQKALSLTTTEMASTYRMRLEPSPEQLLKADWVMAPLMMHATVLMTFGLCSPPLAITIIIAICTSVLRWKILVGRFVMKRLQFLLNFNGIDSTADNKSNLPTNLIIVQDESGYFEYSNDSSKFGCDYCLVCLEESVREMFAAGENCLFLQVSIF